MIIRKPLLPPNTPGHLPRGLERGGIFASPYVPATYNDMPRPTVPTDSPVTTSVTQDIFSVPVVYARSDQVRVVGHAGMGAYLTGVPKGMFAESADVPAYHLHRAQPIARVHGRSEGGIFGHGGVVGGMAVGQRVPMRWPPELQRDTVLMKGPPGLSGGPDGLGGYGSYRGCGCGG